MSAPHIDAILSYDELSSFLGNRQHIDVACPMCGPDRRSPVNRRRKVLRVYAGTDGFISYNCARCNEHGYVFANNERKQSPIDHMTARARRAQQEAADKAQKVQRTESALAIWNEAQDPRGTIVETYFRHRGLDLPDEAAGEAIRFHPACPFGAARTPAMVALVRDVLTNEPKAIHRTAIDEHGRKAWIDGYDRLSLGPVGGGAVKLTPDEEVTLCLGVGEGIETTLSMRLIPEFGASPIWSLLYANNIEQFLVLPSIECLWIAVDHDDAGAKAAYECAKRWRKVGRETFLIRPKAQGDDLNDIIRRSV